MASLKFSTILETPREEIWNVISELDQFPDWIEFIDSITYIDDGPVGEGTAYRAYGGFGPLKTESQWQITAWDQPSWQIHKGDFGLIQPLLTFELEPTDGGTRFHQTVEFTFLPQYPRLGWWLEVIFIRHLLNLFIGQAMKPSFRQTIRNVKRLVESKTGSEVE